MSAIAVQRELDRIAKYVAAELRNERAIQNCRKEGGGDAQRAARIKEADARISILAQIDTLTTGAAALSLRLRD